jgi:hypothetical protein
LYSKPLLQRAWEELEINGIIAGPIGHLDYRMMKCRVSVSTVKNSLKDANIPDIVLKWYDFVFLIKGQWLNEMYRLFYVIFYQAMI